LLWNKFIINLFTHLRHHICLQFYFANFPLPAFSNIPTVNTLSLRTQYTRTFRGYVVLQIKAKFLLQQLRRQRNMQNCMQISTFLPYIRGPSLYWCESSLHSLYFVLQFRNLTYPVFHGYDGIALQLSPVEGVVTRHLVGNCRSLS